MLSSKKCAFNVHNQEKVPFKTGPLPSHHFKGGPPESANFVTGTLVERLVTTLKILPTSTLCLEKCQWGKKIFSTGMQKKLKAGSLKKIVFQATIFKHNQLKFFSLCIRRWCFWRAPEDAPQKEHCWHWNRIFGGGRFFMTRPSSWALVCSLKALDVLPRYPHPRTEHAKISGVSIFPTTSN